MPNQSAVASTARRFKQQDDMELDYLDGENVDAEYLHKLIEIGEELNNTPPWMRFEFKMSLQSRSSARRIAEAGDAAA